MKKNLFSPCCQLSEMLVGWLSDQNWSGRELERFMPGWSRCQDSPLTIEKLVWQLTVLIQGGVNHSQQRSGQIASSVSLWVDKALWVVADQQKQNWQFNESLENLETGHNTVFKKKSYLCQTP